jgi:hypothetical protein
MLDLNIDFLVILGLIFIILIIIAYLGRQNICNYGLCKLYDMHFETTIGYLISFLFVIFIVILIYYFLFAK